LAETGSSLTEICGVELISCSVWLDGAVCSLCGSARSRLSAAGGAAISELVSDGTDAHPPRKRPITVVASIVKVNALKGDIDISTGLFLQIKIFFTITSKYKGLF
jgi:hypothetical protein